MPSSNHDPPIINVFFNVHASRITITHYSSIHACTTSSLSQPPLKYWNPLFLFLFLLLHPSSSTSPKTQPFAQTNVLSCIPTIWFGGIWRKLRLGNGKTVFKIGHGSCCFWRQWRVVMEKLIGRWMSVWAPE